MRSITAILSLAAALLAAPVYAQPAGMGGGPGKGMNAPADCRQAANPEACAAHREARAKAAEACRDLRGPERRNCQREQMSKRDCSKARNPEQCQQRMQAYSACQGQTGNAFRQCVRQKGPSPECTKAADPRTCEQHRQAREACKDKFGPEHRNCVMSVLNPGK